MIAEDRRGQERVGEHRRVEGRRIKCRRGQWREESVEEGRREMERGGKGKVGQIR